MTELLEVAQQGPPGPPGRTGNSGTASPPIAFAFSDASPRALVTMPDDQLVLGIKVIVTTPFNGVSPAIQVGIAGLPDSFVQAARVDLTTAIEFEFTPNLILGAAQTVILTLVPGQGCTQGAGLIVFEQIPYP